MYRYEESEGIKLNEIGVERSMAAHTSACWWLSFLGLIKITHA